MIISQAYQRTAEIQKVVYNARSMILMYNNKLTNYAGYATKNLFVAAIQ